METKHLMELYTVHKRALMDADRGVKREICLAGIK